ncbi:MAG TPA: aldehyde dehydrogenase family protein [Thermoanaerobaculia bacterium]
MTDRLERLARRAHDAFAAWRTTSVRERAAHLIAVADDITRDSDALARLVTSEVSKTIRGAATEIAKCADYCRWLEQHGERILAPRHLGDNATLIYEPLGVVAGIMPWNFPLWQVFRFAAPALLAGNTVVVKHSPLVPRCAEALQQLFARCGDGVFTCVAATAEEAQRLIACEVVRAVSFTGGADAGAAVAATAGAHLKKCILELGGSDAFIVMPSANLDAAVQGAASSRMRAGGQACTAAKRFLIAEEIADEFTARLIEATQRIVIGDPFDPATELGPLVREEFADRLERQLRESVDTGARILSGGRRLGACLFEPTVVAVDSTDVPLMQEETFGPVAPLLRVRGLDEAIAAANRTRYGLSASIWTEDAREIDAFTRALHVGQLYVNATVSSRFDVPFGGTKDSGFGRELGDAGIYELVNGKSIVRN